MKKLITILFVALGLTVIGASTSPPPAQAQAYCGHCCDTDPWGNARIRCTLGSPGLCGYSCVCYGIAGNGFACY